MGRTFLSDALDVDVGVAGVLALTDVTAAASAHPHRRAGMLRRDMTNPSRWWEAMAFHDALTAKAQQLLGDDPKRAKAASWDFDPMAQFGVRGNDGKIHSLSAILGYGARDNNEAHRALYDHATTEVAEQLRQVNACLVACSELDVAPFMWAPYRRYLEKKVTILPESSPSLLPDAGRQFFEVAFPAYLPTTIRQFSRLRSDKRLQSLRAEILRAVASGETLDPVYPQRVLQEVLKVERKLNQVRRISGWIASAVGIIPLPGLGIAATAGAEAVGAIIEKRKYAPWHWFYLISDGCGAT